MQKTKKELRAELDTLNVKYEANANVATLEALLAQAKPAEEQPASPAVEGEVQADEPASAIEEGVEPVEKPVAEAPAEEPAASAESGKVPADDEPPAPTAEEPATVAPEAPEEVVAPVVDEDEDEDDELDRPSWADPRLWESLNDEQKERMCEGKNWRN